MSHSDHPTAPTPRPWAASLGAALIGLAAMSVVYAPQPLLADIARDLDRSALEATSLMSAATIGIALGVFPMAWVSARMNRVHLIAAALLGGAALTMLTAWSRSWELLVLSRLVAGVVIAAVLVSALVWAAQSVPPSQSRKVAALYVAGTTGGGIAGRLVSGLVAEHLGWRWGIAAVDVVVVLCGVTGVLFALRVRREATTSRDTEPSLRRPAGRRLARVRLYALGFCCTFLFVGLYNTLAFRMTGAPHGWGSAAVSLLYLTYLAGTLTSAQTGALLRPLGLRRTLTLGLLAVGAGLAMTAPDGVGWVVSGLVVTAAGFFIVHTAASSTVPRISPAPSVGSAWYTLSYYGGASVGALALSMAWDLAGWTGVLGAAGTAAALALLLVAAGPVSSEAEPSSPHAASDPMIVTKGQP